MRAALLLAGLLTLPVMAGCLSATTDVDPASVATGTSYPFDAAFANVTEDGKPLRWSQTLVKGPYEILPSEVLDVYSFDGTQLNVGIFRPNVPDGTKVPVIMDVGPYYGDGDEPVGSPETHRLGGFLIENFVPHGYAVVQASIRGTGDSTGCVDYMGDKEQRDIDALVTYFGEVEWSNGAVGMIGRSYDGSTPWEAATFGNPYLKTIVPISGIHDLRLLHYRNGTSESRALSLGTLYYTYGATNAGLDGPEEDPMNVPRMACAEGPTHAPMGAYGYATGGGKPLPGPLSAYWESRQFTTRVLDNYEGSLFYIHGLQDWNVKPAQGADIYNAFEGKKKALLGQWAHNYPDRPDEHNNLRWDWAEMLLRWFDGELKGIPTDTGPSVEIEDNHGNWRAEPENFWPPVDANWTTLHPSEGGALVSEGATGAAQLYAPTAAMLLPTGVEALGQERLVWESEPFAQETRISGMPLFHVTVVPTATGGNLWAELHEVLANGSEIWIGRASMNLNFADGTDAFTPIVAQQPILAKMQFYPMDARLLEGSHLKLVLTQERGLDPLPNAQTGPLTVRFGDDQTLLSLPVIDRPFAPSRWDVAESTVEKQTA